MDTTIDRHVTALGAVFIAYGVMGLIATVMIVALFSIGVSFIPEAELGFLVRGVGLFIAGLIAITEIPAIIVGIGLLKRQSWARIGGIIVAAINIMGIPVGTALGVYALWVLLKPETMALLSSEQMA